MCRLFGLHADGQAVKATFWLLQAPDNLAEQSRRNPDGTGLGVFGPDGTPVVRKQPIAAWRDTDFTAEAQELTGTAFIAHVRYATTGSLEVRNSHPFLQDGRLFAHNGVVEGLDGLDARLDELGVRDLVLGETDSERIFALITASVRARGGDIGAGIADALHWLADSVPIYAVNLLLATPTDMWALRYPDTHELYLLDRTAPDDTEFSLRTNRISASSPHLVRRPAVVFASEPMDDEQWQLMTPGELVHVDAGLRITRQMVLPDPPARPLTRADLSPATAESQHVPA
ncbi:class II glutamine amidotransferase [Mycolicibacterium litorale]|uniref:Class II glutamine amidotransferase n=1 Tax=Mycolicibacterium litorale TaxID=758802 RepID=A0AAD1IPB4_9MYCO|nr:class II glutamine amidotransferase [Mycolicibacterium litorale]MCV7417913.1 class II glutamine amidotransferase [Mycolicibacterium litorale]TDY06699.1 glutamine amidotransferase [Mycolicibacterium litorale]BBY19149.1 class II glutamine amidotransferase [Mycolicibacterium litorale]